MVQKSGMLRLRVPDAGSSNIYSAAEKCNRRRWDPPKTPKAVTPPTEGPSEQPQEASEAESRTTPSFEPSFWDYRAPSHIQLHFPAVEQSEEGAVGTAASPTSDERVASQALAELAQSVGISALAPPPPPPAPSIDSVLELANQLSSLESSCRDLPATPVPASCGCGGNGLPESSPEGADASYGAELSATYPANGGGRGGMACTSVHRQRRSRSIDAPVARAERQARIHGYEIRDGVILESELLLNGSRRKINVDAGSRTHTDNSFSDPHCRRFLLYH
ncbi:hypothetical protein B0H11DRAFT_1919431 [Mycena galericulata]|nr:hypothetical protein B0H11DRAFT_1919431 [Mycena galericulata]